MSHGSDFQDVKRVLVTKKKSQGVCHKLRSGSEFKGFPRCPGAAPSAWKRCLISEPQLRRDRLEVRAGSDLSFPSLPLGL